MKPSTKMMKNEKFHFILMWFLHEIFRAWTARTFYWLIAGFSMEEWKGKKLLFLWFFSLPPFPFTPSLFLFTLKYILHTRQYGFWVCSALLFTFSIDFVSFFFLRIYFYILCFYASENWIDRWWKAINCVWERERE